MRGRRRCRSPSRPPIHRLHDGDGDDHDRRQPGHALDHLGLAGPHRLRDGAGPRAARRVTPRAGDASPTSLARAPSSAAGTKTLSVTFTPTDTTDYTTATATTTITVAPGHSRDHLESTGADHLRHGAGRVAARRLGQCAGELRLHPGGGTVLGAGSQTLSVTFTPTDTIDYTTATATTTITVDAGHANDHLELAGADRLRDEAGRGAARRHRRPCRGPSSTPPPPAPS